VTSSVLAARYGNMKHIVRLVPIFLTFLTFSYLYFSSFVFLLL
jgi:hypothetical protein